MGSPCRRKEKWREGGGGKKKEGKEGHRGGRRDGRCRRSSRRSVNIAVVERNIPSVCPPGPCLDCAPKLGL